MKKNTRKEEQIERIAAHEEILDRAQETLRGLEEALRRWEEIQPEIGKLDRYYQSDQWKQDFEDDERGKFPKDLKRGVLSEDGIYDVLERNREMKSRIKQEKE